MKENDHHAITAAGGHFVGVETGMSNASEFRRLGALSIPDISYIGEVECENDFRSEETAIFREMEAIPHWTKTIRLHLPIDVFEQIIIEWSDKLQHGYTGFMTSENGIVTSFTRTLYPRRKYGTPSVEECDYALRLLAEAAGAVVEDSPSQQSGVRVAMGLYRGYSSQLIPNGYEQVMQALPAASVSHAEIIASRVTAQGISVYREPIALIQADHWDLDTICLLSYALEQERFTVEDFSNKVAYQIESPYCTQPDGGIFVSKKLRTDRKS